ncbi:MAG: hypothetical protein QXS76_02800, partial [Candidatus Bathyarchaeia archaeon]
VAIAVAAVMPFASMALFVSATAAYAVDGPYRALNKELKWFVCKGCGALLIPPKNCRVRIRSGGNPRIVLTCLDCGSIKRFPMGSKGR